jgi:hypothetical protein
MKIAKSLKLASAALALPIVMTACEGTSGLYEKEMYEKVICLMSDSKLVFNVEHRLAEGGDTGHQSIAVGGSRRLDEDVTVELEPDTELLALFNKKEFDIATAKYYRELPADKYTIPSMKATLKAGSADPYVTLPIQVQTLDLSPDLVYVIPLKVKSVFPDKYKVDATKYRVLYRVYAANDYATQYPAPTRYQSLGNTLTVGADIPVGFVVTKTAAPISPDKFRIMVAGTSDATINDKDENVAFNYNKANGIVVKVGEDNTISYSPYGSIEVEGIYDDSTSNVYIDQKVGDERRRTFYLKYRFRLASDAGNDDKWVTVTETLRRME